MYRKQGFKFKFALRTKIIRRSKIGENYFSRKFHQNLRFLSLSLSFFVSVKRAKDPRLPIEEITSSNLIPSPPFFLPTILRNYSTLSCKVEGKST